MDVIGTEQKKVMYKFKCYWNTRNGLYKNLIGEEGGHV